MATSFQPEDQHPQAKTPTSSTSIIVTAVLSALAVVMLFALAVPRVSGSDSVDWLVTLGAGVVTLIVVLVAGFMRRSGGRTENPPADSDVSDPADQGAGERPSSTSAGS